MILLYVKGLNKNSKNGTTLHKLVNPKCVMGKKQDTTEKQKTVDNFDCIDYNYCSEYDHYDLHDNYMQAPDCIWNINTDDITSDIKGHTRTNSIDDYKRYVYKFKSKPTYITTSKIKSIDGSTEDGVDNFVKKHYELSNDEQTRNKDIIAAKISFKRSVGKSKRNCEPEYASHHEKMRSNWLFSSFTVIDKAKTYDREKIAICKYDGCDAICLSRSSYYYHISTVHGYKSSKRNRFKN